MNICKRISAAAAAVCITLGMEAAVTPASFPGGDEAMHEFITSHMKYPQAARDCGIEGVVNVGFVVKADGSIGTIKILRMIDPDLEQEAVRIVKEMPAWNPATDDGKPVDSEAQVAIGFHLQ